MFGRKKSSQNDVVSPVEQRLQKLVAACNNDPNQDVNIATICQRFIAFKQGYHGSYDEYLIKIENAILAAIHDLSPYFLDIIVLKHLLETILKKYQDERHGERTLKNSTIVKFLEPLISDIDGAIPLDIYSQYRLDLIQRYNFDIVGDQAENEPLIFLIARQFRVWSNDQEINQSLIVQKFMVTIGREIYRTLKESKKNPELEIAYTLDLCGFLDAILDEYKSIYELTNNMPFTGYGEAYWKIKPYMSDLNERCIYPQRLEIIKAFVAEHPIADSNLKRIASNFLQTFSNQNSDDLKKIKQVVSDAIIKFRYDRTYFEEVVLIDSLKKILGSYIKQDEISQFLNDNIFHKTNDPLYYQDRFYITEKNDLEISAGKSFQKDISRMGKHIVFSGKLVSSSLLALTSLSDSLNFAKQNLFLDSDTVLTNQLGILFSKHTFQSGLSHLTGWSFYYLNSVVDLFPCKERCAAIMSVLNPISTSDNRSEERFSFKLFYPIKNGYGIILKSYLKRVDDCPDENDNVALRGCFLMGYELTLDESQPNADHFTVRCTGLRYDILENNPHQFSHIFLDKINEKANLIFPWQRIDLEVSYFAYDIAIKESEDLLGYQLQEIAKNFCAVVRENYSVPSPNKTKVEETNALGESIKQAIQLYKTSPENLNIQGLTSQLEELRNSLFSNSSLLSQGIFAQADGQPFCDQNPSLST